MARKPSDIVKLQVRLPEALRRRLEREAARKKQSMNAEIINRLTSSFTAADLREMIRQTTEATTVETIDKALATFKERFGELVKRQEEGQS
jgi:hypothetical protein